MKISIIEPKNNLTRADLMPGTLFTHSLNGEVWIAANKTSIVLDSEFMKGRYPCVSLVDGQLCHSQGIDKVFSLGTISVSN